MFHTFKSNVAIKPEAIIWMLWAEDLRNDLPDVLKMLADEYPRLMETIDKEQRQEMVQLARGFLNDDDEATWALKMSSVKFLVSSALSWIQIESQPIRHSQCWRQ